MAAPLDSNVTLPLDTGNTGKKIRTQTRLVGADTVHEYFFVEARYEMVLGVYRYAQAQGTVAAAAQNGTTTGMLFGHVPASVTGKAARLRRLGVTSHHSTALATPTAPRLVVQRITGAAALSTGLLAPAKVKTAHPTAVMLLSAVPTGITGIALGNPMGAAGLAGALTAVGAYEPCYKDLIDPAADEDEWPQFEPGEGFVVWQDTAGTASDTRKFNIQLLWDEIDTA
jgi:hypothetical protein